MSDTDDDDYSSSDAEVVEPLLRENKRLRWTLAKYQKKNSLLKDTLAEKDVQIGKLEKKDEEREELLSKQEDTIRNLIRQMNEQSSEINFMTEKLKDPAAVEDKENGTSSENDSEVASLKATIDIQSRRNSELSTELQEERKKREKAETDIDMWKFNLNECEREIEQLKEQKEKLRLDSQRMKRDADVSKRLLNDVKLQVKNAKSEQENAQTKAEEQKKEATDVKSQMDKERRTVAKLKEDHDKMKEKFDDYRRGYDEMKIKCDQAKRELEEKKEEIRVKTHQYSRQNRHFKDLDRKYRELTEMHNRMKDRLEEKDAQMQEQEKLLKECQEKVWLKDRVMQDFQSNAEEAIERANELDKNLEEQEEDTNTKNEKIADLTRLVEEMKAELASNDVKEIKQELATQDALIDNLKAKLSGAKKDVEHKEQELEYLKKTSDDFQTVSSNLEEKEYEVTQLEALQSDLRTQITFKDDQLLALQKTVEEQKILLESQMYDLEGYERQITEKTNLLQHLKDQIDGYCKTIEQKEKEIKRHKREKEDAKKEGGRKEKKLEGLEEDIALQKKQLALMEKEIRMRENEVEERESSLLVEMVGMQGTLAEKDGKIASLTSDLMEVKDYIEEEAKLVKEKDKEMDELKDELKKEKDLNKTNDPKSIREVARKQHQADLMKEKRRHEQEVRKLKQKIVTMEEKLKEEEIAREELQKQKSAISKKSSEERENLTQQIKNLNEKLVSQRKARLNEKKTTEDVEMKFWSEEEKYVDEIRAIELSRQKLKVENDSLKEDMELFDDVKEQLDEKTREVEDLKIELEELMNAKKEEKELMKKLLSEGEEVIHMYQSEVQQLKSKLSHEPAINIQEGVSDSVEEMRRLIELEYNIGKETKGFDAKDDEDMNTQEYMRIIEGDSNIGKRQKSSSTKPQTHNVWKYSWYSLFLILISVPVLSSQFPTHVVMTSAMLYALTLGFLIWKDMLNQKQRSKLGETSDTLSKAISDIYDENQNLRKTVEQLIVRVASESVEKNELARKIGKGAISPGGAKAGDAAAPDKKLTKQLEEKNKTIDALQDIRKELTEGGKQLRAKQKAQESALEQNKKVIQKLEQKLRDVVEDEGGVDISTEKILQEIREDDDRKEVKKKEALERFQKIAMDVVENSRHEKILGIVMGVAFVLGVVFLLLCKHVVLLDSSLLGILAMIMVLVLGLVIKSKNEVAKLAQELNEEVERSLESSKEIQELSTLVEKHVEVVTKQKRAIAALERQLKVEHQRNENQKLITAKLTWTIQEGKDIENLLGRSGTYRGQDKKALEHALKKMAEDHVKEKLDLFKSMRAQLAEDDVDNEEKRWILEDLKQATKDITKALPCVQEDFMSECKGVWKLRMVFLTCVVAFLWLFYGKYYGLSLLPLLGCAAFIAFKKTETECNMSRDNSCKCLVMDILFVCVLIATVSFVHSNGYLQEMAFIIVFGIGVIRVAMKKLGMKNVSRMTENKAQEIDELKERVREEVRRQERMTEQMETWKRLLEVERSYNKESDDVISEVREMEQKTQREVRREIERMKKEKRERVKQMEELEKELKKSTAHCSKQRRQMEELNKVIKELEKRQKQGSREIDVLKELNKYEKDELHVALNEEKKAKEEIIRNVEKEKEKAKSDVSGKLSSEKKELVEKTVELQKKLEEERKVAKEFLEQVDSELTKNEKMNGEIEAMKNQMEQERETREDLRKRFREINQIRQDREKILLAQIDELHNEIAKQQETVGKLTEELELKDDVVGTGKEQSKTLYEIQERQISELRARLAQASKTIEEQRQQDKGTAKDLDDSRGRQGKLLKDLSKLQDKSAHDQKTIQKKQKEVKELKASLEKLKRENERLGLKLEAASLEGSLDTKIVMEGVLRPDDKGEKTGDNEEQAGISQEQQVIKDELETSIKSEDAIDDCLGNSKSGEKEEGGEEKDEEVTLGVPADFDNKDTQGILYWLATSGGASAWKNPGESGIVGITRSSYGHGKASDIAERKPSWCSTSNKSNQWWKIDFGEKKGVLPSAYTLQHGWSGVSGALRNWVLEGSRDGKVWSTLMNHVDDETLTKGYATATWKINDVSTSYRYLRVRQTGKNSAGKDSLRLCGFEVYGQLVLND